MNYNDNRTVQQRILHFLTDYPKESFTRVTIATQTGTTKDTAARELTDLRNGGYIQQSKGDWSTTQKGIELYTDNPNFTPFHTKPATERRENWAELLGPEVLNLGLSRQILQAPPRHLLEVLKPALRLFAVAWLVAEEIPIDFNAFDELLPHEDVEDKVANILNDLAQEIAQEIDS